MNQTKKITQGAMMLAIVGALILIDRMSAYWFSEFITLMMPVVIILYSAMHTLKDGAMLSVGLLIISFLLGNFQIIYLIYVPAGIITGMTYAWGISRNMDKKRLLLSAIVTYVFSELVATFIIYPLFGFPVAQMLKEYQEAMSQAGSFTGIDYVSIFTSAGIDFVKLIGVLYVVSTVIMGAIEGLLIHILSIFLLKRFKIKDLGNVSLFDMRPNPVVAYLAMFATSLLFLLRYLQDGTLYYVVVVIGVLGAMVLLYYGYIFLIFFGVIVLRRNIGAIFMIICLFVPSLLMVMMVLGFLYGSGPLRNYLEVKAREAKEVKEDRQ